MNKLDEKYLKIMELALKLNPDPTNRLSTGYKPTIEVSYDGASLSFCSWLEIWKEK